VICFALFCFIYFNFIYFLYYFLFWLILFYVYLLLLYFFVFCFSAVGSSGDYSGSKKTAGNTNASYEAKAEASKQTDSVKPADSYVSTEKDG
jgi:hypothetical protein